MTTRQDIAALARDLAKAVEQGDTQTAVQMVSVLNDWAQEVGPQPSVWRNVRRLLGMAWTGPGSPRLGRRQWAMDGGALVVNGPPARRSKTITPWTLNGRWLEPRLVAPALSCVVQPEHSGQ